MPMLTGNMVVGLVQTMPCRLWFQPFMTGILSRSMAGAVVPISDAFSGERQPRNQILHALFDGLGWIKINRLLGRRHNRDRQQQGESQLTRVFMSSLL